MNFRLNRKVIFVSKGHKVDHSFGQPYVLFNFKCWKSIDYER